MTYSHGGGAVYNLARHIQQTKLLKLKPNVTLPFTAYIDAIQYSTIAHLAGVRKVPPQTLHLLNVYETNQYYFYNKYFYVEHHGVRVQSPKKGLVDNINVTPYGYNHGTIATSLMVQYLVETQLKLFVKNTFT